MRTERITFLSTPQFKALLVEQAKREEVSVAELVRRRFEQHPTDEEAALLSLASEVRKAVTEAKVSLQGGLVEAREVLKELQARREAREKRAVVAGGRNKAAHA
ncbi:MAG: hypothetical protein H0U56_02995 [Methylibium sp.]|uniref:hypothetical protein n=1 Tax=Methylibium sp. TaxID=2067992 RepID=UPI0017B9E9E6|nr:hypothetical protein [Methylibium sp.]MBA2721866.1 hypothetical protein [Methylibium sp.]MBA3592125.1 hypothetical protein [Methylibium sp.]